jgi:hypothetical protein
MGTHIAVVRRRNSFKAAAKNIRTSEDDIANAMVTAPKKKQEKMALGDFLNNQCTRTKTRNTPLAAMAGVVLL